MTQSTKTTTVTDPICSMTIDPATAAGSSTYEGRTYSFCAASCKTAFDAAPAKYATAAAKETAPAGGCCSTSKSGGSSCC